MATVTPSTANLRISSLGPALSFKPTVSAFIQETATGEVKEGLLVGTRGEGKTTGAAGAILTHADIHARLGYELPTTWLGCRDTFKSHKENTHRTLLDPIWRGAWRLVDQGQLAELVLDGVLVSRLRLLGVKDRSEIDQLRTAAHGLWFEEPAPAAVMVSSSGLAKEAWETGLSSLGRPPMLSHANPAILTLNYPHRAHWTWQRFFVDQDTGRKAWRIPPGERVPAWQREIWAKQISDPAMRKRLIDGEPADVGLGDPVAAAFRRQFHVLAGSGSLAVDPHAQLWLSHDGGLTPTTLIGQRVKTPLGQRIRVYAGLTIEHGGTKQLLEEELIPWLQRRAPWILDPKGHERLGHTYDPSMDVDEPGDAQEKPLRRITNVLLGELAEGPTSWTERKEALDNALDPTRRILEIEDSADTELLLDALGGKWDYAVTAAGAMRADKPRKPNHPWEDLGDTFCYLMRKLLPEYMGSSGRGPAPSHAKTAWNRWDPDRGTGGPTAKTGHGRW